MSCRSRICCCYASRPHPLTASSSKSDLAQFCHCVWKQTHVNQLLLTVGRGLAVGHFLFPAALRGSHGG